MTIAERTTPIGGRLATLLHLVVAVARRLRADRARPAAPAPSPALVAERRQLVVAPGEDACSIAEAHGMATASFLVLNGMRWGEPLEPGRTVLVARTPSGAAPRRAAGGELELRRRVVREGETIEDIAAELGLASAVLLRANGIVPTGEIFPGLALVAPARVDPRDTGEVPSVRDAASAGEMNLRSFGPAPSARVASLVA